MLGGPVAFHSGSFQWSKLVMAGWSLATGVLLVLFVINVKPPGIPLALGLGAVFGLGRVTIGKDGLSRQRHYASLSTQWVESMDWPYESIQRCIFVPGENSGHPFSVILLGTSRQ